MAVIYPKLYVKCQDEQDWSVFNDVTAFVSNATWYEYEGTYRDLPKVTFGTATNIDLTVGTSKTSATAVPIVGDNTVIGATGTEQATKVMLVAPDDALHVAPRAKLVKHTGYLLTTATDGALPAPPSYSVPFGADVSGILTSGGHEFTTGDLVTVSSDGTLPGGLSATELYLVVVMDTDRYRLRNASTGIPVAISSGGSGDRWIALVQSAAQSAGVFRFSDHRRPQFSTSSPE